MGLPASTLSSCWDPLKSHCSYFGSSYKLGCWGHTGLLRPGFEPSHLHLACRACPSETARAARRDILAGSKTLSQNLPTTSTDFTGTHARISGRRLKAFGCAPSQNACIVFHVVSFFLCLVSHLGHGCPMRNEHSECSIPRERRRDGCKWLSRVSTGNMSSRPTMLVLLCVLHVSTSAPPKTNPPTKYRRTQGWEQRAVEMPGLIHWIQLELSCNFDVSILLELLYGPRSILGPRPWLLNVEYRVLECWIPCVCVLQNQMRQKHLTFTGLEQLWGIDWGHVFPSITLSTWERKACTVIAMGFQLCEI